MRKTQVALAALALVASSAALADITVSGVVDAGYTNAGGGAMVSGLLAPNFLTIGGSEDVGNGMKAHFELRERIFLNTGEVNAGGTAIGHLFTSFVGLSGDFGTVNAGKTFDSFWANGIAQFDVTGGGNMGSTALDPTLAFGLSGTTAQNSVQYISPSIAGLTVAGTFSPSADNGNKSVYNYTATYNTGALSLGAGNTNNAGQKGYFVGGGYDFGVAKVNATYLSADGKGTSTGVNAAVPLVGALTGTVGISQTKADANSPTSGTIFKAGTSNMYSVGLKYALSKRTTVFGNYQQISNGSLLFAGMADKGSFATSDKSAVVVGLSHAF